MAYHLTSRTFDTEAERTALESQLKRAGFRHVSPRAKLKEREYRLIDGTSDPGTFEGQIRFGVE